jgi:hypothetical protein
MSVKYVFDRSLLQGAIHPTKIPDLLYDMRLTPSQMQTFFYTEPSVEKLKKLRALFPQVDPLSLLVPAPKKVEEK